MHKESETIEFKKSTTESTTVEWKQSVSEIDGVIKTAAEVLFCDPFMLEFQAAVFAGTDKVTFLDIRSFKGNIFSLREQAENYVKEHIKWRAEIKSGPNQSIYVPKKGLHRLENPGLGPLKIVEVQCGSYLEEDDIERAQDDFERK